ncbi:MAG: type II secretion system minor pseudopilin GspI [Gammaproteobacteria bacterium]|nr:type II secretion system minor pseudopilin GspI [Gammaproteobacteria bacterium]
MNSIKNEKGLTLIEVLIALAILGIAFTAVIHTTATNIRQTTYVNNRTLATWAGLEIMREVQLKLRTVPLDAATTGTINMGDQPWQFQIAMSKTPNAAIQKITVNVFSSENTANSYATLNGFYDEK